ncbi:hypothetical protein CF319_g5435 [Tilletia indica]|nr:hypothetical protein CF319_g5435 [Tilletia indica]
MEKHAVVDRNKLNELLDRATTPTDPEAAASFKLLKKELRESITLATLFSSADSVTTDLDWVPPPSATYDTEDDTTFNHLLHTITTVSPNATVLHIATEGPTPPGHLSNPTIRQPQHAFDPYHLHFTPSAENDVSSTNSAPTSTTSSSTMVSPILGGQSDIEEDDVAADEFDRDLHSITEEDLTEDQPGQPAFAGDTPNFRALVDLMLRGPVRILGAMKAVNRKKRATMQPRLKDSYMTLPEKYKGVRSAANVMVLDLSVVVHFEVFVDASGSTYMRLRNKRKPYYKYPRRRPDWNGKKNRRR